MSKSKKATPIEAKSLKEWMEKYGVKESTERLPTSSKFQEELNGSDLANQAIDRIIHERTREKGTSSHPNGH